MDCETIASSFFRICVMGEERSRSKRCATLKDRENLHNFLERKAEFDVRGEAEADLEVKHWENRNSDIALYEIDQEFESQRLQLHQANQWADQAERDEKSLEGELEMRNRLSRQNQAKNCSQIEEMRRICCEETDRAR